jgi:hypothetical protein
VIAAMPSSEIPRLASIWDFPTPSANYTISYLNEVLLSIFFSSPCWALSSRAGICCAKNTQLRMDFLDPGL